MEFIEFWQIVENHGRVAAYYKAECEHLWTTYTPDQQKAICESITHKLRTGRFVHYNPVNAMRDNAPQTPRPITLSYAEYYKAFGTTEEVSGWKKVFLPDQQKTIYIKN